MIDENKKFETWEEVIVDFLLQRENRKVVDLLSKKDSKKSDDDEKQAIIFQVVSALSKDASVDKKVVDIVLSQKNSGKNKVIPIIFLQNRYEELVSLSTSESVKKVKKNYNTRLNEIKNFHVPQIWFDYYSSKSSGVSFSTHVAKITHSSIKAASFFVGYDDDHHQGLLTTDAISKPVVDDAIDNAALTPIASFLKLDMGGIMLGDCLFKGNAKPLSTFTESIEQLESWRVGFSEVFSTQDISSHTLLKQVYFPVEKIRNKYHILNVIQSSSLAHELFLELTKKVEVTKKYSSREMNYYPNKAKLSLTASKKAHTNVSPLHAKRDGKIYLLSNQPPTWQSHLKPPIYKKSLFEESFFYQKSKEDINYLREFLLRFDRIDLSINNPERRKWIDGWLANIIDELLFYMGSMQSLPSGWSSSDDIKLKPAHQYLLDPYRKDVTFQAKRNAIDWQSIVCEDFAHWLNRRLIGRDKQFTPQPEHRRMWVSLLEKPLREHSEQLQMELKFQAEVRE